MLEKSSDYVTTLQNEENRRWQQMEKQISVMSERRVQQLPIKDLWKHIDFFSFLNVYYLFLLDYNEANLSKVVDFTFVKANLRAHTHK